ncbi:MAG: type I restriction enzyme HsdR N-terminal domain-containing protein [Rikenellaceae bacterium]
MEDNTLSVWVPMRKCYIVLTPEEWVRRHVVGYLTTTCGVEPTQICEEYPVKITSQAQRADIVVMDRSGKPAILVECKAANIPIDKEVFAQAVRYNSVVGARYVVLSNGLKHFCFEYSNGEYLPMNKFPQF